MRGSLSAYNKQRNARQLKRIDRGKKLRTSGESDARDRLFWRLNTWYTRNPS